MKNQSPVYSPPTELDQMEQGILGALLSGEDLPASFDGRMFYSGKHTIIYKAARHLQARGIIPDILSVTRYLGETGQTAAAGGLVYVAGLTNNTPLKGSIAYYAETVAKEYEKRKTQTTLLKALEEMRKPHGDTAWIVQNVINELSEHRKNTGRKIYWTAAELKDHEFPDIQWVVPDLVAAGLSALCGAPKVKKSWLALSIAIAVASGGAVLGKIAVQKQAVVYLALEDSPRRLKDRMNKLNAGCPENLSLVTEWKTGAAGLKSYLHQHKEIKFCIIDTWGIFSPHRDQNAYSESTIRAHELKAVADELSIAIMIVHHARKNGNYGDTGDWMDSILGSTGLAGAVDSILLLRRRRGEEKAELLTTGRDILEHDFILSFDLDCGGWTIAGNKTDIQESELRQSIVDWLKENGPHTPAQITRGINAESEKVRAASTVKTTLTRMVEAGILQRDNGTYSIPVTASPPNTSSPDSHELEIW